MVFYITRSSVIYSCHVFHGELPHHIIFKCILQSFVYRAVDPASNSGWGRKRCKFSSVYRLCQNMNLMLNLFPNIQYHQFAQLYFKSLMYIMRVRSLCSIIMPSSADKKIPVLIPGISLYWRIISLYVRTRCLCLFLCSFLCCLWRGPCTDYRSVEALHCPYYVVQSNLLFYRTFILQLLSDLEIKPKENERKNATRGSNVEFTRVLQ